MSNIDSVTDLEVAKNMYRQLEKRLHEIANDQYKYHSANNAKDETIKLLQNQYDSLLHTATYSVARLIKQEFDEQIDDYFKKTIREQINNKIKNLIK